MKDEYFLAHFLRWYGARLWAGPCCNQDIIHVDVAHTEKPIPKGHELWTVVNDNDGTADKIVKGNCLVNRIGVAFLKVTA